MLNRIRNCVTTLLISFLGLQAFAQSNGSNDDTSGTGGYYLFPVKPGEVNFLAGTMGELRPNHFHAGIDIKTGGVVGYSIHSAADGYVSRIKVATNGYGNALYVAHPNGTTTVYAHLDKFNDVIGKYVREAQYKQKSFDIELFPEKTDLPVKRGEVIGMGGNSGSSGGPHLHFEIRDANQEVLNPLTYGFKEIKDDIAPLVYKIALKTMDVNSRINNQYGRFEFNPAYVNGNYVINEPIEVYGNIGVEILTYDKLNGADNLNGFPCIEMFMDGRSYFEQKLNKFSFDQTRHIEVHTDYTTRKKTGQKFIRLYVADGNELPIYKAAKSKGVVNVEPDSVKNMKIHLVDTYGNKRDLNFKLAGKKPKVEFTAKQKSVSGDYEIQENILKFHVPINSQTNRIAKIYANRMAYELAPAYIENSSAIYLWDLRIGLPDSIDACNQQKNYNFAATVPSNTEYSLYLDRLDLFFPRNSLFDTLYLQTGYQQSQNLEIFTIDEDVIPLQSNISITLKPEKKHTDLAKTHVYNVKGVGNYGWEGGNWNDGKITFRTRSLGDYTILTDSVPPTISVIRQNKSSLSYKIHDELSGIKNFEVYVNGEWVLMNYDYKRRVIWSEKLDESKPFAGDVVLKVTDNAGNVKTYQTKI